VDSGTCSIAVVDDDEAVRKALARLLRIAGFQVCVYASGAEFIRAGVPLRPDCVLLDLHMPALNGFEVQQALAQSGTSIPVVMITGEDSDESRERALRQGALAFLPKPVDEVLLLDPPAPLKARAMDQGPMPARSPRA